MAVLFVVYALIGVVAMVMSTDKEPRGDKDSALGPLPRAGQSRDDEPSPTTTTTPPPSGSTAAPSGAPPKRGPPKTLLGLGHARQNLLLGARGASASSSRRRLGGKQPHVPRRSGTQVHAVTFVLCHVPRSSAIPTRDVAGHRGTGAPESRRGPRAPQRVHHPSLACPAQRQKQRMRPARTSGASLRSWGWIAPCPRPQVANRNRNALEQQARLRGHYVARESSSVEVAFALHVRDRACSRAMDG
jgi:hypothetical protein